MTDEELILKTKEAKKAAHEAPLAEITDVNKNGRPTGDKFITRHTQGYSDRANDWVKLSNECDRRGLKVDYND